jgi:histidyl-tRNA synthetase
MSVKPQNAKGTRDFGPLETNRRNFIFDTIKKHFKAHGFMPLETPAVENLDVLTGKYGEEGDKLLFKILNSGDYLKKVKDEELQARDARSMTRKISDRGLKYDLTVPFARYVSKNQNDLAFPFKRYQIQPVWRADRPQKGRYREFYQCDADIIGTDSLLSEVSLMQIYNDSLVELGIEGFSIKINNRKILQGFASKIGALENLTDMTIAIDKLDKIGKEKVFEELKTKGFNDEQLNTLDPLFSLSGSNEEKLAVVKEILTGDELGEKGVSELEFILSMATELNISTLDFDATLARGLDYYTGAIFEVKLDDGSMGSIGAGGRYDDLTSLFGVKDLSGVGISFGAARIYDVMEARELFKNVDSRLDGLFINFSDDLAAKYLSLATELRKEGHSIDIYPSAVKMKKQMNFANKRGAKYVFFLGESEVEAGTIKVKNMDSGEDRMVSISELKDNLDF